jgi:hypothetical protein
VARRPAEVHPQEHLRPVGGLGAAGARADRDHGAVPVVLAGEQEQGPLPLEVLAERSDVPLELGFQLGVRRLGEELRELSGRLGARLEAAPRVDLVAEALGLLQDGLGRPLVIPEPGFLGLRIELGEAAFGGLEVKDAPRSTGSARRDP